MNFKLEKMTIEDKLKAMEVLWDDICRNLPDFSSPEWHENVLKEREEKLREGKDKFVDWDQAKKRYMGFVSMKIKILESAKEDLKDGFSFLCTSRKRHWKGLLRVTFI